jgi:ABC-type lipoprotein export system ATPase subunit
MGASGSGKSTLLHLIAGLEVPSSGTVTWPGLGISPVRLAGSVAMVFQGVSLMPPLTVLENVAMPLLLIGVTDRQARLRAAVALDRLDMEDLADRLPEELSGGQAQRVCVARAIAGRPRLVLADEPTGQLDSVNATHVVDVLIQAADELDAGLVICTHDPLVANRLATRWSMHDGVVAPQPLPAPFQPGRGGS